MSPEFYLAAIPAVLIAGLSKGGFGGGIGMVATPLLALAVPPVTAAAILLPVLVAMDAIGVWSYRRHVKWSVIAQMMPGALIGIALGWATAAHVNDDFLRVVVGAIAIGFAIQQFAADCRQRQAAAENLTRASFWGTFAGYTSFVSHAGGPPFQAYALPLRLDKLMFAGTGVVFFAAVNAAKLVPYFALGQFDRATLSAAATLLPVAVIGVLLGVWAVRKVSQAAFYNITYAAMILVGSKLVHDGLAALL
ncbi:MAG: UPF0721 transmembrane protein [Alphaproteobacteria bacterium]|nr:MAG: UPF0721 transmembrane protein [Alphaproteobacteria bacterium]